MPPTFVSSGESFDRVTIAFVPGSRAKQARSLVQNALIRAHGLRSIRRLTDDLAVAGGVFRLPVARKKVPLLRGRLRIMIDAEWIRLWVRGKRVKARK